MRNKFFPEAMICDKSPEASDCTHSALCIHMIAIFVLSVTVAMEVSDPGLLRHTSLASSEPDSCSRVKAQSPAMKKPSGESFSRQTRSPVANCSHTAFTSFRSSRFEFLSGTGMTAFAKQFCTVWAFTSCHDAYIICTSMESVVFIACMSVDDVLGPRL